MEAADARAVLAKHGRTFSLASRFLPADTRDDAARLYAFCRGVDDLADEVGDEAGLRALREELAGGAAPRPLVAVYLDLCARRGLSPRPALDLVDGAISDLGDVDVPDERGLLLYAYRVAGTVGLMMRPLLGADDPRATPHAVDLGIAMQLTNIARDVVEDAGRGRVYLPATWRREAGIGDDEAPVADGRWHAVVLRTLDLADAYYASGEAGLGWIPWRTRLAIAVASRVYRAIGAVIRRRGPAGLARRAVVATPERLWHAAWAVLATLAPRRPHDPALHVELAGRVAGIPG